MPIAKRKFLCARIALQVFPEGHPGAVYLHRGQSYLVDELDLEHQSVHVQKADLPYYTQALADKESGSIGHPGVILGYVLRGLGSVGVLFAGLLRAAFSRQREYLADAAGVQYTRNPMAMASLLAAVRDSGKEADDDDDVPY